MDDDHVPPGLLIGIADDHPMMRAALRSTLQVVGPATRFAEASDVAGTLALIARQTDLDLLLMDLNMPGASGLDAVRAVRERAPLLPLAVISAEQCAETAATLFTLGVAGFIPKSDPADVIVGAVRLMLAGGVYVPTFMVHGRPAVPPVDRVPNLTARQLDALRLLAEGKPNKVIARELGVTEGTVKVHLLAVFRALGVRNRTAAVIAARDFIG